MAALEQSLDVPGWVTKLTAANPARDQVAARAKELMDKELLAMGDDITKHPEIGFVEYESIKKLTDYLKAHDFTVEMGVGGLKTAFVARYNKNNGAPNLGVILEYDALRGTKGAFHGDQHSTQGPIGMAAGIAMAEYLTKNHLPGSVIMYGTPGEEMMPPAAKTQMFKAGVFKDADIIVRSHSSAATSRPAPGFGSCCLNINGTKYTFSGAPAHQMTAWNGRNALTADDPFLRQHRRHPQQHPPRVASAGDHHRGRRGAERRARSRRRGFLHPLSRRDLPRAAHQNGRRRGARRGARHRHESEDRSLRRGARRRLRGDARRSRLRLSEKVRRDERAQPEPGKAQGSKKPARSRARFPDSASARRRRTTPNHTYEMLADALTDVGHKGFVIDAEAMASLLFDFATHPDYRAAVKKEFEGIHALFGEYQEALKKVYTLPVVPDPQ